MSSETAPFWRDAAATVVRSHSQHVVVQTANRSPRRGYVFVELEREGLTARLGAVDDEKDGESGISTLARSRWSATGRGPAGSADRPPPERVARDPPRRAAAQAKIGPTCG